MPDRREATANVRRVVRETRSMIDALLAEGLSHTDILAGIALALGRIPAMRVAAAEPRVAELLGSGLRLAQEVTRLVRSLR